MLTRTQTTTLAFRHPSRLKSAGDLRPTGACRVGAKEESLGGLSLPAHRRVSATVAREMARTGTLLQARQVGPQGLAGAHAADRP
jgi:hypothetical protein